MDAEKLLAYLRYLRSRLDALQNAPIIGLQEITPLQSELRIFRDRVAELNFLSPNLREHFHAADFSIPSVHLAGSREYFRKTWWMNLPYFRTFLLPRRRAKDREIIDAKLAELRNRIYNLYCLVEVTVKNA